MAAETKRVYLPQKQQVRRVNCVYRNCVIQAQRKSAMKHDSPHFLGESPSSPISPPMAGWAAWRGGMTTEIETTPIEIRDIAYWPNEALLAAFAEEDDRVEQPDRPLEDSSEYAILYFVS